MTVKDEVRCILEGIIIILVFSYFFYRAIIAIFILSPFLYYYRKDKNKKYKKIQLQKIEKQFKELLLCIRTNIQAGYAIENSFIESRKDMIRIFGEESLIVKELEVISSGLKNGISMENLLLQMGKRYGGVIEEFASVYQLGVKMGGRWNDIIDNTVDIITQKIELKEEIKLLIYEKELEHRIMCIIPFCIMCYMDLTSGGYFRVLYHNIGGIIIMTLAMAVYIYAYKVGEKITEIEI